MTENKTKSMEEIVYITLKDAILQRLLAPGTQLVELTISEKLHTSRTPVRNAMKKLAADGIINIIPNKGAFVISPSLDDILQAYEIRAELECVAMRLCINDINETDIAKLKAIVNEEYEAIKQVDITKHLSANKQFHMFFSIKYNNKFLVKYTEEIIDRINIYLRMHDKLYNVELNEISRNMEHKEMIELISKKDAASLEPFLRKHIATS
ncbi:MAG: GntR family transcriptional regulator, partial [Bacillota bacterium]|nr:GntR family transcriptional regulator [Bacillota bacterium]